MAALLDDDGPGTMVQVIGRDHDARLDVAAGAATTLGFSLIHVAATDIPADSVELATLARLVAREAILGRALVAIDVQSDDQGPAVSAFGDALGGPSIVCGSESLNELSARGPIVEVLPRTAGERLDLWVDALGPAIADSVPDTILTIAGQFDLTDAEIGSIGLEAHRFSGAARDDGFARAIWDACRLAARPRLDGLAARVDATASWPDLVLPDLQLSTLREITSQVRQRHRVYEEWGFAAKGSRGLGISALFAGSSGTGKTMAAEVLANELRLDLYRIDLASVVSKYIGETEKNLRRVFDAAEGSGAILLFDEADALFGKRSEVKDSHDRYANIEVSYLLQRMEAYRGLAILTTNVKPAIDSAFLRRLRFIVQFPFPDSARRSAIWRGAFPARTPIDALDWDRLAQLNIAGGHIRNIALGAAFLAAERGEPVSMGLLAESAHAEYIKLERPLGEAEARGWA